MNTTFPKFTRLGSLAFAALLYSAALQSTAAPDDEVELAETWTDRTYGLTLRPPAEAQRRSGHPNGPLVHFTRADQYTITLKMARSKAPFALDEWRERTNAQMAVRHPNAHIMQKYERIFEKDDKPGWTLFFTIPDPKQGDYIIGQSVWEIDPQTHAILRLEADANHIDHARKVYEAVVDSLALIPPEELKAQREKLLERGQRFLNKLEADQYTDAIIPEQWFRIVEQGKDVGYMLVRETKEKSAGKVGILVSINSRLQAKDNAYDSEAKSFIALEPEENPEDKSERHRQELWSFKRTIRPLIKPDPRPRTRQPAVPGPLMSWAETGVRGYTIDAVKGKKKWVNRLIVTHETPSGLKPHEWHTPKTGYLSQVESHLLSRLLPHDEPREYAFYAYSSVTRELNFRTERIEPQSDGTFKLFSRPSLDGGELVGQYDRNGKLIRQVLPDGRELIPATPQRIEAIWQLK